MYGMVDETEQFECPECGKLFGVGTVSCPGCGMVFEWDEEETEEALDDLIEQVVEDEKEGIGSPEEAADTVEEAEPPYDPTPEPEVVPDADPVEEIEPPYDPSVEAEEKPEEAPPDMPEYEAPMALEGPVKKKKALSMLGMIFAVLTVVSVIGLMVVLNYDVWINGDEENNIGDTQMMYVYLAVAAVIVSIMLVVVDLVRNRKAA